MSLRIHQRRWLSGWLVAALLFMQFAVSAYGCPGTSGMSGTPGPSTLSVAMAGMPDCDASMTADPSPLCKAHCEQGTQTVGSAPALDGPSAPVLWAVLDWGHTVVLPTQRGGPHHPIPAGATPPGSPPLYLTLLVLRN